MQNLNELIVLGIVFLSVIVFSCVFLPEFFFQKKVVKKEEDAIVDDPMARFIEPQRLQQLRYSLSMVIGVVTLALVIIFNFYWGLPICAVLMVIAYHIPKWSIDKKIKKRNDEFEMGMLDFTILIANSLRAGIALPSAIEMAIQTVGGAINEEFTIVLREHRLGIDLVESIERLNKRIKSENLQLFSATVCVTMRTGGSMADVLDHVVETMRMRTAFFDKLKTMITQSEFEAICISLSPFAACLILYILNKDLMTPLFTTKWGWLAIGTVITIETIGFIVIKQVTKVKF